MTAAGKSVLYFGYYLVGLGLILLIAPNLVLGLFGMQPTHEVWIGVVGMLVLALSVYYIVAGRNDIMPIIKATVGVRSAIILFFIVFSVLGLVSPMIILFGVVDLAGAIWTYLALKKTAA